MQKKQGLQSNDLSRHCVDGWLACYGKLFSCRDAISGRVSKSGRTRTDRLCDGVRVLSEHRLFASQEKWHC